MAALSGKGLKGSVLHHGALPKLGGGRERHRHAYGAARGLERRASVSLEGRPLAAGLRGGQQTWKAEWAPHTRPPAFTGRASGASGPSKHRRRTRGCGRRAAGRRAHVTRTRAGLQPRAPRRGPRWEWLRGRRDFPFS